MATVLSPEPGIESYPFGFIKELQCLDDKQINHRESLFPGGRSSPKKMGERNEGVVPLTDLSGHHDGFLDSLHQGCAGRPPSYHLPAWAFFRGKGSWAGDQDSRSGQDSRREPDGVFARVAGVFEARAGREGEIPGSIPAARAGISFEGNSGDAHLRVNFRYVYSLRPRLEKPPNAFQSLTNIPGKEIRIGSPEFPATASAKKRPAS